MKRRTQGSSDVVTSVEQQTAQAAELARIAGQGRLMDPRLNPATRTHADRLLVEQHRKALEAEHARLLRRHRVTDRRAEEAERTLEAIGLARRASSPARSVLALHTGKRRYLRLSLAASLALAAGSAMGVEATAEALSAPVGSGYIAEVGLTGLATAAITYRAHLAEHRGELAKGGWQSRVLWTLMTVPLLVSVACNLGILNVVGAFCAIGAAAFSLLSCVIADRSAAAMQARAEEVTEADADELRAVAMGEDLFAAVQAEPELISEPAVRTGGAPQTRTDVEPTSRTARTDAVRTEESASGSNRPVRPSVRTDGPARTTSGADKTVDRDQVVAHLADELREAVAAGEKWAPDYKALMAETGYGRSWCEKVVRDARRMATFPEESQTRTDDDTATRTDARTDARTEAADQSRTETAEPARTGDGPDRTDASDEGALPGQLTVMTALDEAEDESADERQDDDEAAA